jgi:hypothetical protein
MKPKPVLKFLAELYPKVVEAETAKPAQTDPKPSPAGVQQPREIQLPIRAPEHSDFEGYRHWGINE